MLCVLYILLSNTEFYTNSFQLDVVHDTPNNQTCQVTLIKTAPAPTRTAYIDAIQAAEQPI